MQNSIIRKTIDLQKSGVQFSVSATKNDSSSRTLMINITDGGKPYLITDDVTVIFYAVKPDGKFVFNNCSVVNESTVSIDLKTQTLNAPGIVEAQIRFESVGKLLTTSYFNIEVNDCNDYDGAIESSDEFSALTEATAKVNEFLNGADSQVKQAVETAEQAVETANAKIDKQQGIENAGSILKVGADGYIGFGDIKNHLKTKVLYSYEEFEAFISELYEGFLEYAPVWLIFGINDENNDISLGSGYLIFDDGSGIFDNALLISMSASEIPFTQEIRDEITANKRTRFYPLKAVANLSNQYLTVFNYDDTIQTEIKNISNNTKQVKLIIFPRSTCTNVYIGHGAASLSHYDILVDLTNKESATVDVYFIVDKNGFVNRIIYDCGEDSRVIFPTKKTSVESLYLTAYGDEINFTVSAFGEG
ncbi:MAG: phage baseplate upper protein [Eubacterium sp.]|nr:phage baseplate upper protein [Eubacterium sp.]